MHNHTKKISFIQTHAHITLGNEMYSHKRTHINSYRINENMFACMHVYVSVHIHIHICIEKFISYAVILSGEYLIMRSNNCCCWLRG